MNPQTIDIETFIEVVEKGSFGRAAGSMLVSQPAISDRILRLETRRRRRPLHKESARGGVDACWGALSPVRKTDRWSALRGRWRSKSDR